MEKPRPYWHVDAKWIIGILAVALTSILLLIIGFYRLTAPESAPKFVSQAVTSLAQQGGNKVNSAEISAKLEPLYTKGPQAIAQDVKSKSKNQAQALSLFTLKTHNLVGVIALILSMVCVMLFAVLIYFSHRLGRLVSPAVVLVLSSILLLPVFTTMATSKGASGPHIATLGPEVLSLIGQAFVPAYAIASVLGATLLLTALILKTVRRQHS